MSKFVDLTGEKFGYLTVLSRADDKISPSGQKRTAWKCQCVCGKVIEVTASNLKRGNSKSCGCEHIKYLARLNTDDLTGQRFGNLTVLRKDERTGKNSYWICRCDCGTEKAICATSLKRGQKSCGCVPPDFKTGNEYHIDDKNVVHVTLRSGEEMLCDRDDWEEWKEYTWSNNHHGYAHTQTRGANLMFHVAIKGKREGYVIDHADRNKLNNQKSNLRFLTQQGNSVNTKLSIANTTGVKGVTRLKNGKWCAQIMLNGKHIGLGRYNTLEEAEEARKKGEEKYHKPLLEEAK